MPVYGTHWAGVAASVLAVTLTFVPGVQGDVFTNVPEAAGYELVYTLPVLDTAAYNTNAIPYSVDNSAATGAFDRIAYYMELDSGSGLNWAYASMDAFTNDRAKVGVPSRGPNGSFSSTAEKFQQTVSNMNVFSNAAGIATGTAISTGNIEFWSTNYGGGASGTVPGGTGSFDFDDTKSAGDDYGSMQIHNYGAAQTIMAYNRWGAGNGELGIGNQPTGNPDWTFSDNVSSYSIKNLQVLVQPTNLAVDFDLQRAIFQRDDQNTADVPIDGVYDGSVTRIEARAVPMSGFSGTATDWLVIDAAPAGGSFAGELEVSGGWYRIEVRSFDGAAQVGESSVDRVGVGEIFVTAGQSNSANHGDDAGAANPQTPSDDRVSAFDGSQWQFASDPQPIASGTSGSPWPALGDLLTAELDVPVGFYSVGVGGTAVSRWVPAANDLYPRIEDAVTTLGPDGFRAILWHQGENDAAAGTTATDYASRLQAAIDQSRIDAGFDVPWGVALASYRPATGSDQDVIDGQLMVIGTDALVFEGAATDDMIVPYRGGASFGGIHFNAAGLAEHARRWNESINGFFDFSFAVPEPSSFLLALFGLFCLAGHRRRSAARH